MKVAEVCDSVIVIRHEGLLVTLMNRIISPSDMTFLCIFGLRGIFCVVILLIKSNKVIKATTAGPDMILLPPQIYVNNYHLIA